MKTEVHAVRMAALRDDDITRLEELRDENTHDGGVESQRRVLMYAIILFNRRRRINPAAKDDPTKLRLRAACQLFFV